jgi:acyl-coenzyme A thioesterase PaaI-like protein
LTATQRLAKFIGPARFLRWLSLYPPYLGAGIRVAEADRDLTHLVVELKLHSWNKNFVGTHFGGSMYSMCDPFFMLMLMQRLGPDYTVWDKAASIDFLRPGTGKLRAVFELPEAKVQEIKLAAQNGEKTLPRFRVEVLDEAFNVVAKIEKTLYVRKRR